MNRAIYKFNKYYYDLHGIKYEYNDGRNAVLSTTAELIMRDGDTFIYRTCDALEEDTGKCKLHGTPKKPRICVDGYEKRVNDLVWIKECIYTKNKPQDSIFISCEELLGKR